MRFVHLLVAVGFASLFAHATAAQTDPKIGFGGGGSISASCTTADDSSACSLSAGSITATLSDNETGGIVDLNNDTGLDVTSLTITDLNLPTNEALSCLSPTEFFLIVTPGPDSCTFSGNGVILDDFPAGDTGGILLQDFDANSTIELAVTAPEPSSMVLLGVGLLAVFAIRKRRGITRCEA
jgi:PEP-CTERM motif